MSRASRLCVDWASSNKLLRAYLDFPCWYEADIPKYLGNVRYWENSGKHLLAASISPFDPTRTLAS